MTAESFVEQARKAIIEIYLNDPHRSTVFRDNRETLGGMLYAIEVFTYHNQPKHLVTARILRSATPVNRAISDFNPFLITPCSKYLILSPPEDPTTMSLMGYDVNGKLIVELNFNSYVNEPTLLNPSDYPNTPEPSYEKQMNKMKKEDKKTPTPKVETILIKNICSIGSDVCIITRGVGLIKNHDTGDIVTIRERMYDKLYQLIVEPYQESSCRMRLSKHSCYPITEENQIWISEIKITNNETYSLEITEGESQSGRIITVIGSNVRSTKAKLINWNDNGVLLSVTEADL